MCDRGGFEPIERKISVRDRGQFVCDFPLRVRSPHAYEPVEFLAIGHHFRSDLRGIGFRLRIGRLLIGEFQIVDRAAFVLSLREVERSRVRRAERSDAREQLLLCLERVERCLHLRSEFQDGIADSELSAGEFVGRYFLSQRDQEEIEKILDDPELEVGSGRRPIGKTRTHIEARIFQQPRFGQIRVGDADFLEDGLQLAVIQQGHLHGSVSG